MTYDICVVGSEALIYPFLQFGFTAYTPKDTKDLRSYLEGLVEKNYGIVYIEDSYCFDIKDILEKYQYSETPIFVPIGEQSAGESYSRQMVNELMEKAIGVSFGNN